MLTLVLLTAVLQQTPEPSDETAKHELTATLELTGGPQLGASISVDYGLLPDKLYLSGGYTLLKTPPVPASGSDPGFPAEVSHVFFAGADYSLNRHFNLAALLSGSPRAVDSAVLNPLDPPATRVSAIVSRSSLG